VVGDLLGLLVPLGAVAELRTAPPAQPLRLRLDALPEPVEPLLQQGPVLLAERRRRKPVPRRLDRLPTRPPESPVRCEHAGHVRCIDRVLVVLGDVVPVHDRPDVLQILLVQMDDLELREKELGKRNRLRLEMQAVGDRDHVAHAELPHEDIDLPAVLSVVEDQARRAVHRVEAGVRLVPELGEKPGYSAAVLPRRHEIDVLVRAREARVHGTVGMELDRHASEDAKDDVRRGGRGNEPASLVDDVRPDRGLGHSGQTVARTCVCALSSLAGMAQRTRPARLDDVARAAGVHVSTVSRVINGRADVSVRPETRQRILAAARELQYRPNAIARGLRLATTGTLGLLVPSLRNPVNSAIVRGAFDRAWERSFVLVLAEDSDESEAAEEAYERLVEEGRIDGLLIQSARLGNTHLDDFSEGPVPCVFIDRAHPGSGRNVTMRDADAGRIAAEHLLELGHRSIAHLAGPDELDTVARRRLGFVERVRAAGCAPAVLSAPLSERGGQAAMQELLARTGRPTAVYIANINQALGAVAAVRSAGIRVPDELSLLCHDDDPVCEYLDAPLTAIRMPLDELGSTAVDVLLDQIDGGAPRDVEVGTAPELVRRRSTGPAPP
jgi:DNA-binding LacI/PurR family transcriptional regulator